LQQVFGRALVHPSAAIARIDKRPQSDGGQDTWSSAGDFAVKAEQHARRQVVRLHLTGVHELDDARRCRGARARRIGATDQPPRQSRLCEVIEARLAEHIASRDGEYQRQITWAAQLAKASAK